MTGAVFLETDATGVFVTGLVAATGVLAAGLVTTGLAGAFFAGAGAATLATGLGLATTAAFFAGVFFAGALATTDLAGVGFFGTALAGAAFFTAALVATGLAGAFAVGFTALVDFTALAAARTGDFDVDVTLFPPEAAVRPFFASPVFTPPFPAAALATAELRAVFAISFTLVAVAAGCYSPDVLPQQPVFWNTYNP